MSNYYTQSQQPSASGPINFSSWSENDENANSENDNKKESNIVDPNSTKLYREHFRTARDNAVPVFSGAVPSSTSIPSSQPPSTNQSWLQQYWYVLVIVFFVFGCVFVFGVYYKNLQKPHIENMTTTHRHTQPSSDTFGSSGLSNASGLLQDLEFL
jgi:hypothetical protein